MNHSCQRITLCIPSSYETTGWLLYNAHWWRNWYPVCDSRWIRNNGHVADHFAWWCSGSYCALSVAAMTNLLTPELTKGCADFIKRYGTLYFLMRGLSLIMFFLGHKHTKVELDLTQAKKLIMDIPFVVSLQWKSLERHMSWTWISLLYGSMGYIMIDEAGHSMGYFGVRNGVYHDKWSLKVVFKDVQTSWSMDAIHFGAQVTFQFFMLKSTGGKPNLVCITISQSHVRRLTQPFKGSDYLLDRGMCCCLLGCTAWSKHWHHS